MYPESLHLDSFLDLSSMLIQDMPYLTESDASSSDLCPHSSTLEQQVQVNIQKPSSKNKRIKRNQKLKIKRNRNETKKQKIGKKKSVKRKKAQMGPDYRKNICGYVVKKIIKELAGQKYQKKIREICQIQGANYNFLISFYSLRVEGITGPSHVPPLLTPTSHNEHLIMRAFLVFFKWFLEQRYIRHLLNEGKMQIKKAYIEYKNKELMPLILQLERKLQNYSESSTVVEKSKEQNSSL